LFSLPNVREPKFRGLSSVRLPIPKHELDLSERCVLVGDGLVDVHMQCIPLRQQGRALVLLLLL
jgi:hypothetical protein